MKNKRLIIIFESLDAFILPYEEEIDFKMKPLSYDEAREVGDKFSNGGEIYPYPSSKHNPGYSIFNYDIVKNLLNINYTSEHFVQRLRRDDTILFVHIIGAPIPYEINRLPENRTLSIVKIEAI